MSQRVQKRISNIDPLLENEKIVVENIEQHHLDKVLNLLRESNWDWINERLSGVVVFFILKISGQKRNVITDTLKTIESITYNTAELYVRRLLSNEMESLTHDNHGKYHKQSVFEYFPDFKDHIFEYVVDKVSEKKLYYS